MKFGKLPSIDQVHFSLPDSPSETLNYLKGLPPPKKFPQRLYYGCTGWSMPSWKGKVYPEKAKTASFLSHYGRQFTCIELNSTYYRIPSPQMVESWCQQVPSDFRFCPKVPQTISHSRDWGFSNNQLALFSESVGVFGEKLGACFLQLPPYFDSQRLPGLRVLLERWPKAIPLAVEFRHPSWFEPGQNDSLSFLREYNVGTVITDVAGRRDVLHMQLTQPFTVIRFVGNGLHFTDFSRMDEWIKQLKVWMDHGLSNIFFFPHQPDNLQAPEMCVYLVEQWNAVTGSDLRAPRLFESEEPPQLSLF